MNYLGMPSKRLTAAGRVQSFAWMSFALIEFPLSTKKQLLKWVKSLLVE